MTRKRSLPPALVQRCQRLWGFSSLPSSQISKKSECVMSKRVKNAMPTSTADTHERLSAQRPPDHRTFIGCQMLLLHSLRKRRRRLLERRASRSLQLTQNTMYMRRVQRRQSRIQFLLSLLKTGCAAYGLREAAQLSAQDSDASSSRNVGMEDLFSRERLHVIPDLSDEDWFSAFRISRELYEYLLAELKPFMCVDDEDDDDELPAFEQQVAIALWRLGRATDDTTLNRALGVSADMTASIVRDFCGAVVKVLMPRLVQVPFDEDLEDIMDQFKEETGLPQCAGALCISHVPIQPPSEYEIGGDYTNSEGWSSIVVQAVVGADRRFWDLNIGWPGSTPQAQVLRNSSLWRKGEEGSLFASSKLLNVSSNRVPPYIIARNGYPLRDWIITPVEVTDERREKFNKILNEVLAVGETAFRRLESRFPYILRHNGCGIDLMPTVVAACSTLHNLCEDRAEDVVESWLDDAARHSLPQPRLGRDPLREEPTAGGEALRAAILATLC
ncbi:uncharacterized protein LOC135391177 [Ornithodoros turicata]